VTGLCCEGLYNGDSEGRLLSWPKGRLQSMASVTKQLVEGSSHRPLKEGNVGQGSDNGSLSGKADEGSCQKSI
jgi:hypothetical protein